MNNDIKVDRDGNTDLHWFAYHGELKKIKKLLNAGIDVNIANDRENTPLHFAAIKGQLDVVKYLIKVGAKVNLQNDLGNTPLHIACNFNYLSVIEYLILKRAAFQIYNKKKCTSYNLIKQSEVIKGDQKERLINIMDNLDKKIEKILIGFFKEYYKNTKLSDLPDEMACKVSEYLDAETAHMITRCTKSLYEFKSDLDFSGSHRAKVDNNLTNKLDK
jgi:ankyrin repeat protein